jgi:hypothetical protein
MKTFDPKCLELARAFLEDEPALLAVPGKADELAGEIQACIETWIGDQVQAAGTFAEEGFLRRAENADWKGPIA